MANPQKENGHVGIANEIVDAFCQLNLSGSEWRVLWVILRKTYGWNKKDDHISLGQFSNLTGIGRQNIPRIISKLENKKIIRVTKYGKTLMSKYSIIKDFSRWECDTAIRIDNTKTAIETDNSENHNIPKQEDLEKSSEKGVIEMDNSAVIKMEDNCYQNEQKVLSDPITTKDNTKDNTKDIYIGVFDFWQKQKLKYHRKYPPPSSGKQTYESTLKNLLKDYTNEEICQAIENYRRIIKGDEYYFSHVWTLTEFLIRGFHKFEEWKICHSNYLSDKPRKKETKREDRFDEIEIEPTPEQMMAQYRPIYGWDWEPLGAHEKDWDEIAAKHGITRFDYGAWREKYSQKNGPYTKDNPLPKCEYPGLDPDIPEPGWDV